MRTKRKHVAVIFGTRPEVTKLAPLIFALQKKATVNTILIATGQHDDLFTESMEVFGLSADYNLRIMKHGQTLTDILTKAAAGLDPILERVKPVCTITLGDASTTFAASLVSFYHRIPVAHIEAGMRTGRMYEPFPEEANRHLIATITEWFFPATQLAKMNLLREGYNAKKIFLAGTTEADALHWVLKNTKAPNFSSFLPHGKSVINSIIVTTHRRENWGKPLKEVFLTIRHLVMKYPHLNFIHSAHPNPLVYKTARRMFSGLDNIIVLPHIDFLSFAHLLSKASLIMTDSGGIQVDAAILRKPLLILRNVTEWQEVVDEGLGKLVGTNSKKIIDTFEKFMTDRSSSKTAVIYSPGASNKIVQTLTRLLKI